MTARRVQRPISAGSQYAAALTLSMEAVTSVDSGCSLPVGIRAWECFQALLSLWLQTWP